MTKKLAHTLIFIGLVLIITGLIAQIIVDNRDNQLIINDYKKQIEAKDELIEQQGRTIIKLRSENEALWDNYYMNVSEYDGEYYE
jgi:c-di-AMP phosphodiesterase-like protein